jgi:hypothetical protein
MLLHRIIWATSLAILVASVAKAQPVVESESLQNTVTPEVPIVQYKSAFSNYVPYSEQEIVSWRQANDLVGEIGGWRTYAKEAQAKDSHSHAVEPQLNPSSPSSPVSPDKIR